MPPTLESVRDELYGLPPDEFVAARTEAEKAARKAGDRETAAAIKALGKPTVVAWLANQLVRARRDEIEPLLDLGASLREATRTLSGEDLRALSQQQHQVIMALVRQARALAKDAGQPVTDATATGVEETLRAALADEDLSAQLAQGALTSGLSYVGFGLMGGAAPVKRARPAPETKAKAKQGPADEAAARRRAEELEAAEQQVADARTAAEQAFDVERHARSARDDAEAAAGAAADEVETLRSQLAEAEGRQATADDAAAEAANEHDTAAAELERSRAVLADAEHHEQELRDGGS